MGLKYKVLETGKVAPPRQSQSPDPDPKSQDQSRDINAEQSAEIPTVNLEVSSGEPAGEPATPATPEADSVAASADVPETPSKKPAGEPVAPPAPESETERKNREDLNRIQKEFDENEKKIAEARAKNFKRWRTIGEALGLIKRPVDEGDDVKEYLERRGALYKALRVSGVNAFRGK